MTEAGILKMRVPAQAQFPIQRIERGVQTNNLQAILHPNTNPEIYGRITCGLGPNTLYI
jgi:hypothetical protein